ncbi:MAG: hypothetical protein J6J36_06160 [Clostridia bacterium]|nr:hypothetical protein [Clostridia bacterium]
MNNDIYYIKYEKMYAGWLNRVLFRYNIVDIGQCKHLVQINRKVINKKVYEKIIKITKNNKILFSNNVVSNQYNNFFSGKLLMKYMIIDIIKSMQQMIGSNFIQEDLYIAFCKEVDYNILSDLSKEFKSINIITDKIRKIKRIESKLERDNIAYSISNNKKKALKKAKILINMDYSSNFFEEFYINRNCIIINLNPQNLLMKNSFQGSIIERIEIDYINNNEYLDPMEYDKNKLYESYIIYNKYIDTRIIQKQDKCIIKTLLGSSTKLSPKELKNNFIKSSIKLDKNKKKD